MSRPDPTNPRAAEPATDLDAGVLATFQRQPPALPGWQVQPMAGTAHSFHVTAGGPPLAGHTFGVLTDADEGLVEVVALLGTLRPDVAAEVVLRQVNAIHQAVALGRITLIGEPARLLFEAELVLGAGHDRQELVERLLPVLLSTLAGAMAETLPELEPFLARKER